MEEYLFKGKVKEENGLLKRGEWLQGSLMYAADERGQICRIASSYLSNEKDGPAMVIANEVDPETICQYTGLHDGTEWWELSEEEQEDFLEEWNCENECNNTEKDWKGRRIFDRDIVRLILPDGEIRYFKVSIKSVVRKVLCHPDFDDEYSKVEITGVVFEWNGYELFPCVDTYGVPDYKMMKVVGNIFDNPELIEGGI